MAEAKPTSTPAAAGNTAVPTPGDHDRVAMLSLRADGTPDQNNPELIGDKAAALAATTAQFQQQAVSAADHAARTTTAVTTGEPGPQDPHIAALQDVHTTAEAAAAKAAAAAVDALHASR